MPNSNEKGSRRERELVNKLDANGFAVMKAPASESATERDLPDVLATEGTTEMDFASHGMRYLDGKGVPVTETEAALSA